MRNAAAGAIPNTTSVHVERLCDCPFSIANEYAVQFLKGGESGGAEAVVHAPLLGRRVRMSFGLSTDITEAGRWHEEIRLLWFSGSTLLPDFRGTIRFRIDGRKTIILIDGTYAPPFGALGVVFDRCLGQWIARFTLHDLARRLAHTLEHNEILWRAAHQVPIA